MKPNSIKPRHFAGGTWKAKKLAKRGKASQTPGSKKGESCQTSPDKQFFAKRSRSYKHPGYAQWCQRMDRMNTGTKSG